MEIDPAQMNSMDQENIEAIKKRYREISAIREPSGLPGFINRVRSGGKLLGGTGAILIGALFLVVGIHFMRTPVKYLIWGDKVSATAIRYEETQNKSGLSRSRVPVVSFLHDGQQRTAFLRYHGDIYLNQKMTVRYLADSPATVIAEWPVKSLSIYSIFLVFGAGIVYPIVRHGFNATPESSALPRGDCMQPIDEVVQKMPPERVLVYVMEPSTAVRIVLMVIALVIAAAGGFHVHAVLGRVTEMWRIYTAGGFYATFTIWFVLMAAPRKKTTINMNTGLVEQQSGLFAYFRARRWPVSRFVSIMIESRSVRHDDMRSHTTYLLKMAGHSRRQDLTLISYADGITAAFHAKKLSMATGIPLHQDR